MSNTNNQIPNDINQGQKNYDSQKDSRIDSKTTPALDELNFANENAETNDDISSYNYYIYYNSIKPKNENLPKPTYKATTEYDFMGNHNISDNGNNNNNNSINNITNMMSNLNFEQMNNPYGNNFSSPFNSTNNNNNSNINNLNNQSNDEGIESHKKKAKKKFKKNKH
jgi:hypothetical protein